jgi:hypothetical protein
MSAATLVWLHSNADMGTMFCVYCVRTCARSLARPLFLTWSFVAVPRLSTAISWFRLPSCGAPARRWP